MSSSAHKTTIEELRAEIRKLEEETRRMLDEPPLSPRLAAWLELVEEIEDGVERPEPDLVVVEAPRGLPVVTRPTLTVIRGGRDG